RLHSGKELHVKHLALTTNVLVFDSLFLLATEPSSAFPRLCPHAAAKIDRSLDDGECLAHLHTTLRARNGSDRNHQLFRIFCFLACASCEAVKDQRRPEKSGSE